MFLIALTIGIYTYIIFLLGIFGLLYKNIIISLSIIYILSTFIIFLKFKLINVNILKIKISGFSKILLSLIFLQALVNLIGAFGPELSFDALWYHLTIPKIFLENHRIFHIPGNLLYYSDLPKSIEMFYVSVLSFSNEIGAKLIHYCFGLLSMLALYKLSRKFLNQEFSLLSCMIFYSSLVVGWQSTTAYIDLGRTFFEIVALYQFVLWLDKKKFKNLLYSGLLIGFSLSAKISALNSIAVYSLLILLINVYSKSSFKNSVMNVFFFVFFSILVPLPYFIFSYFNVGNPVYPIFENSFNFVFDRNLLNILKLFLYSSDPINPLYLVFLPIIIIFYKKFDIKAKTLFYYSLFSLIFWCLTSSLGGSRFFLPYLPALSVLVAISLSIIKNKLFKNYLILLIIIISISSIGYRFLANSKYIPVILGVESKNTFLNNNLNFSYGDFYDTDKYFKNNIKNNDKVLLYGFHNLYYIDFPYIDSSWIKKGDRFNYIAVQNSIIPDRFLDWKEIYYNNQTKVRLYSKERKEWVY